MKRFFKVIAIFMVVILCVGSVSLLFDSGSEGSGPGTTIENPTPEESDEPCEHRDANDNGVCEYCGEFYSDGCDITHIDANDNSLCDRCNEPYEDGQDVFGGTVTNLVTFDEGKSEAGFSFVDKKYGTVTYSDGYAKLYTTEEDVGNMSDHIALIMLDKDNYSLESGLFDYFTVDFDIWTDSQFINDITFGPLTNEFTSISSNLIPKICDDSEGNFYFTLQGQEGNIFFASFKGNEPKHVTLIYHEFKDSNTGITILGMRIFIDGKPYVTQTYLPLENYNHIRCRVSSFSELSSGVQADRSVCFDNIQVSTFGNGSGSYDGAIATAFNENGYSLTECVDSVLYNKNN